MAEANVVGKTNDKSVFIAPKSVAIFSLAYAPFFGGAEVAVKEITHCLRNGFKFVCFTHKFDKKWPSEETMDGMRVVRVGAGGVAASNCYGGWFSKRVYPILAFWRARKMHKKEPFTAIWAIMASYGGAAALLFKLVYPRVPLLLTLQEGDSEAHIMGRVRWFYPFWKLLFRKADHIQVISNYLADFAVRHGAKCPIAVVPNGVDLSKFKIQNSKIKNKEANYKAKKLITIITTSRLVHKNGVDTLIGAAAELKKTKAFDFRVLIAGAGPEERALMQLSQKLGVDNEVDFLGNIAPDEVPLYLSQADIFARPSRSEGLGNSFLEAMAAGLPVIGTNVGGIPDFLKDPILVGVTKATGLFAKVGDPKDVAQKITLLIKKPELRAIIIKNGQALVWSNYSWETIAEKMGGILRGLINYSS